MNSAQITLSRPASDVRSGEYWAIGTGAAALLTAGFALADLSVIPTFLALMLLVICIYPVVRYTQLHERGVPAIAILTLAYALQFALPVFFGDGTVVLTGGTKYMEEAFVIQALLMSIAAVGAFLFVCYNSAVNRLVDKITPLDMHLDRSRALVFVGVFTAISLFLPAIQQAASVQAQAAYGAFFRVVQVQILVAIGVLAWLTYTSRSPWMRLLYYTLVAVSVASGLSSGFMENALVPLGIAFACQWIYTREINKKAIVAIFATLLFLNPTKGDFREVAWYGDDSLSRVGKMQTWLEMSASFWGDVFRGRIEGKEAALTLVRRASMIDAVAHVVESTPDYVPYLKGETYGFFLYSFIPRAIWEDKPTATANRTLAVQYSFTTEEGAERSTFGASLVGEGYANFGWLGAIGVMMVLAAVLLCLQRAFASERSGPGGYALFLAFFMFFPNGLGSSLEIVLANLIQSMIVSYVLIYWVRSRTRKISY